MSLIGLLATTTLISLVNSTPIVNEAPLPGVKAPVDHDQFFLVLLRHDLGFKPKSLNDPDLISRYTTNSLDYEDGSFNLNRDKRIGSLSIVNSVDVLRQRVLLELARRKAMEDQRQISENRRILDSVGKRSGGTGYEYRLLRRRDVNEEKKLEEQPKGSLERLFLQ